MKKRLLAIICAVAVMFSGVANFTYRRTHANEPQVIPIAMAADNNYTYPLIVAMTSILENKNPDTKIDFYVMLSGDFLDENKAKIMSLQNKYDHCRITLLDMKDKAKNMHTSRHITEASYYRLMLPSILPELDKVLYLDSDIIVQKDLSDLYSQDLENYYLAGVLETQACRPNRKAKPETDYFLLTFGNNNFDSKYVNAGVLLFNLNRIRKNSIEPKLIESATKYNHKYHDQDVLNIMCYDQILRLPVIYNMASFFCVPEQQAIIHYIVAPKPWSNPRRRLANLWWEYTKKTDYYNEIKEWSSQLRANMRTQNNQKKTNSSQVKNTHKFKLRRVAFSSYFWRFYTQGPH